jgi:uncharacterized repeat protein (TIGR01451 family)
MSRTLFGSVLVCFIFALEQAQAQPTLPLPLPGGAPLVFMHFVGPPSMQVGIYQGAPEGKFYAAPATFGMRPGYLHRVQINNPPGHPGVTLFPTLEVRGTLYLPPKLRAASYPAAVVFTPQEIDRVLQGKLLTKVIYLEDPEKAFAVNTTVDAPIELDAGKGQNPVEAALERGRPMVIVRLGSRHLDPAEMAQQTKPGLILAPDQQRLEQPPIPPYLPITCWSLFDPVIGPWHPTEECLRDGGDRGLKAGFDAEGKLRNLEPADTVAEYKDAQGKKQLAVSNEVCICVPRFGVIRAETSLGSYDTQAGLGLTKTALADQNVNSKTPSLLTEQAMPPLTIGKRERPSVAVGRLEPGRIICIEVLSGRHQYTESAILFFTTAPHQLTDVQKLEFRKQIEVAYQLSVHENVQAEIGVEGPAVVGRVSETQLKTILQEVRDFTACCNDKIEVPEKPLQLCKWAEQKEYRIGDIVTFHLRYSNLGGKPITDVAVSDSLTARLEYIPGSARSDRDAVFTLQQNEAGSVVVRWEINGVLQPGKTGVVTFEARIR